MQSKGLSRVFSNTTVQKHQSFSIQLSSSSNSHPYMTPGKTIALTRRTFVGKVIPLLFNMLPRWVITFLPEGQMKTFIKASCDQPFHQLTISLLIMTDSRLLPSQASNPRAGPPPPLGSSRFRLTWTSSTSSSLTCAQLFISIISFVPPATQEVEKLCPFFQ